MSTQHTLPPVVYHPAYSAPMPPGHRFPMHKYARLAQVLEEEGLIGPDGFHIPEPASVEFLSAVHDPVYMRQVLDAAVPPAVERIIGMSVTRGVSDRAQAAVGGTAFIFEHEPRAFTSSMHGEKNYPTRRGPSDLDIDLPDGTGDEAYLAKLRATLPGLLEQVAPDLVFYIAGVDPH